MEQDGLTFVPLKLADLGEGDVTKQVEDEIKKVSRLLANVDMYGPEAKGKIVLQVDLVRDREAVVITAGLKVVTPPPVKRKTLAFVQPNGELVTQRTEQLSIETMKAMAGRGREQRFDPRTGELIDGP